MTTRTIQHQRGEYVCSHGIGMAESCELCIEEAKTRAQNLKPVVNDLCRHGKEFYLICDECQKERKSEQEPHVCRHNISLRDTCPECDEYRDKVQSGIDEADMVNHPPHYTSHPSGVECRTIARHFSYDLGSALKYIWRSNEGKTGEEGEDILDLRKAINAIQDEIDLRLGKFDINKKEQP